MLFPQKRPKYIIFLRGSRDFVSPRRVVLPTIYVCLYDFAVVANFTWNICCNLYHVHKLLDDARIKVNLPPICGSHWFI